MTFVSATGGVTPVNNTLTFSNLGTLAPGASTSVTIVVQTLAPGTITDTASVTDTTTSCARDRSPPTMARANSSEASRIPAANSTAQAGSTSTGSASATRA